MKNKKNKKINTQKYVSEDENQVRNLIIITLIIVLLAIGLYFLTGKIGKKENNTSNVEFDYSTITVGTMFNRPYDKYYVFLYDAEDDNANQYISLISSYESKDESIKIYTVDLSKNLDSKYLSDKSNTNPTNPSEVKIKDSALILIKNGKVSKYYESITDYEKVLG